MSTQAERHNPRIEKLHLINRNHLRQWIETPESLQNIILVGGGAFLFKRSVKAAFPKHRIHEVKEPMFANVRGFQVAGQNYASTTLAPGRDRPAGEVA